MHFIYICAQKVEKETWCKACEDFFVGYNATSKAYWLWHLIKNHIIVCRNIFFCEDEILTITPNKEDLGEYSINDLSIQGRAKQVLIHQDEATKEVAKPQNEDEGVVNRMKMHKMEMQKHLKRLLMKPNKMQYQFNKMKKSNKMVKKDMRLKRWSNLLRNYYCNTKMISLVELEDL